MFLLPWLGDTESSRALEPIREPCFPPRPSPGPPGAREYLDRLFGEPPQQAGSLPGGRPRLFARWAELQQTLSTFCTVDRQPCEALPVVAMRPLIATAPNVANIRVSGQPGQSGNRCWSHGREGVSYRASHGGLWFQVARRTRRWPNPMLPWPPAIYPGTFLVTPHGRRSLRYFARSRL